MKKVILVGSTGVIGSKVQEVLQNDYEIVTVNRTSGDYKLDMADSKAVEAMFQQVGKFDILIATSGYGKWGPLDQHAIQDFHDGLNSKLMGQVNLVMIGKAYANENASFALTSGYLAQNPTEGGLSLSMINAGLEAFVRGVNHETNAFTINAISPTFAKETMELMGMDSSHGTPAIEFAKLYKKAIEEGKSGEIYSL